MSRDHNLGDIRETPEEKQIEELKTEVRRLREIIGINHLPERPSLSMNSNYVMALKEIRVLQELLDSKDMVPRSRLNAVERQLKQADDFKLLMPLISPLVDAFDGMTNDFRSMMRIDEPNLLKALEEISRAIERY